MRYYQLKFVAVDGVGSFAVRFRRSRHDEGGDRSRGKEKIRPASGKIRVQIEAEPNSPISWRLPFVVFGRTPGKRFD